MPTVGSFQVVEPSVPMPGTMKHMQRLQARFGLAETQQAGVATQSTTPSVAGDQELTKVFIFSQARGSKG